MKLKRFHISCSVSVNVVRLTLREQLFLGHLNSCILFLHDLMELKAVSSRTLESFKYKVVRHVQVDKLLFNCSATLLDLAIVFQYFTDSFVPETSCLG